ncbi:LysM peptidoglycan-binding domain-containing C40 family peptidase [Deinococcus deserti]|uniref:Putative NLP/P60 protein n=1 Tax=Deinococcus deserti (strain DSM 17065 / CIP 109153 / LMG 22923 / VCD115) TaxID=546414 RepID=C1CUI6_DEIDV|nr:LysM peptidoglycan-binding domain-containing C40 family peptidase [Deinococcus deserti]ACO45853.1 putative NLP/P60 protein, precursor [Deinococcus deserti VCD115]
MKRFPTLLALAFAALTFSNATAATYTVKPGDTLYSVARATGMDASTLMKLNKLSSTTIQVGQRLNTGGAPSAAKAPARAPQAAAAPSRGGAFVRSAATRFLGIRYVLGGNGSGGIDCSSYTMNVFRQMGINLPRTAAQQWRVGAPVNRSHLREGDLVFFNTTGRTASHVGIYLGGGLMANANSYKGRSMVEPLFSNPYWASRYQGARRVLN